MIYKPGDFVIYNTIPVHIIYVDIILKNNKVYDIAFKTIMRKNSKNKDLLMYTDIFREIAKGYHEHIS